MNRADLEIKGAEALMTQFAPGTTGAGISPTLGRVYRDRAAVVIDAVEADIRADERAKIASWLRSLETRSPVINRELAASLIERGELS